MGKKIILIVSLLVPFLGWAQRQKFQINGAARGYYFVNRLEIDPELDSITTRKANYGHTLFDMGVSVFPNESTEVEGIFRIRNELGGFWGGGVAFDVRQLTLRGVAGKVVRYELGDIDLSMTPYTLQNFQEEGVVNEADVFALRRDVVHYDMFYQNDTWRMQGAQTSFGLSFDKFIKGLDVSSFLTRQRPTDGIRQPERLFGGGTLTLIQSDRLQLGLNSVNIFDLQRTIPDSIQYKNNVHTGILKFNQPLNEKIKLGLEAEGGISNARYVNYRDPKAPEKRNEWFYDAAAKLDLPTTGISITGGYKDIGADFLSPGAQTKRINFGRFPGLFQQITNNASGRPASYTDFISGATDNSYRISEQLMPYVAAYTYSNPYGLATPNRRGAYLKAERLDSTGFRKSFLQAALLTESRGTGTLEKKRFLLIETGTDWYVNDHLGWKKDIKLDVGLRYELTRRGGQEFEQINLGSMMVDAGLSLEVVDNLDLMGGLKLWRAKGNALIDLRNRYNTIENFDIVDYDFWENAYAGGVRYRFNPRNALSAQYQVFNIRHLDASETDYGISQFTILFSLAF
jgi:hypothetical protein